MKVNIDELLAQTKNIAEKLEKKSSENTEYKNTKMIFLSSIEGEYEAKIFLDVNGQVTDSLYLHSIPTTGKRITVPCTEAECPVCKRVAKLEELGYEIWRLRAYKLYKIFIKTGKVKSTSSDSLESNSVYVAYVNKSFLKGLIEAINSLTEYEESKVDIAKMYDPESNSGGFVVRAYKSGKSMNFNFNFISGLNIEGINIEDTFGSESQMDLTKAGYFRKSYVDPEKQGAAVQSLDALLVDMQEHPENYQLSNEDSYESEEETEESGDESDETPTPAPTETSTGEKPDCFGKDFNSRDKKCRE